VEWNKVYKKTQQDSTAMNRKEKLNGVAS
jgi:hypothetical protein